MEIIGHARQYALETAGVNVLIIEDHVGVRVAMKMLLELEGFSATPVDSGEKALEYLSEKSADVVLLDLNTNGMSAHEFCAQLEGLAQKRRLRPVLGIISGSSRIEQEAGALGADFIVRKPFDHHALIQRLREIQGHANDHGNVHENDRAPCLQQAYLH